MVLGYQVKRATEEFLAYRAKKVTEVLKACPAKMAHLA